MTAALVDELRTLLGPAQVLTEGDLSAWERDWRKRWHGKSLAVVRPGSTAEVAQVLQTCARHGASVVPQGGNTGLVGGGVPDMSGTQVLLSLQRLNRVRGIDPANLTMTVEAGMVLQVVQQAASEAGLLFPLSLAAEGSCTIGGNLATNAGGIAALRYGNMRELALGLEVVLPDGRIWNGLRGLRKDNSGFDLRQIMIGSEGTLGVITAAVLKLLPRPRSTATAWVGADRLGSLVKLLAALRERCGERLAAFEMMSEASLSLVLAHVPGTRAPLAGRHGFHALVELSDTCASGLDAQLEEVLGDALQAGLVSGVALSAAHAQTRDFWNLRDGISQAQVRAGWAIKHDISLPISAVADFVPRADEALRRLGPDVRIVNFGHLGDGNLHYNVLLPPDTPSAARDARLVEFNRVVHDLVDQYEGSISAEHGVGQLRRDELRRYKPAVEYELMMRIKQALDPNHLMNPGKIF